MALSSTQLSSNASQMGGLSAQQVTSTPISTKSSLTPEQMQQNYQSMKSTSPSAVSTATPSSSWDAYDAALSKSTAPKQIPESGGLMNGTNPIKSYIQGIGSDYMSAAKSITNPTTQGTGQISSPSQALSGGLDIAQKVSGAVVSPITRAISPILSPIVNAAGDAINKIPGATDMLNKVNGLIDKHPQAAQDLGNLFQTFLNVGGLDTGGKAAPVIAKEAGAMASDAGTLAGKAIQPVTNAISNTKSAIGGKVADMAANSEKTQWAKPATMPSGFNKAKDIYQAAQSQGHDISSSIVNNGIKLTDNVETSATGKKVFNTADTAEKIHADAAKVSNEMIRPALEKANAVVPKTPVQDIIDAATKNIQSSKMTAEAKDRMISNLNETKISLSKQYPQGLSLSDLHDEKIVRDLNAKYSPVGDVATNMEATKNKAIADAARKMVEQKAPVEIPVKEFNAALAKQHQVANYLDSISGKAVPRSMLSNLAKWGGKITGAGVGSTLGGGILGGLGGYHLGGIIESMIEEIPSAVRGKLMDNLKTANPEAFDKVQSYLNNLSDQNPSATTPASINNGGNAASKSITPTVAPNMSNKLNIQSNSTTFTPKSKTGQMIQAASKNGTKFLEKNNFKV